MPKFYRLNQNISAAQIRVIDSQGKQVGVLTKEEAIAKAKELAVDLVEIGPNAKPPIAKLIDFKKFKYEESKKERLSKKNTRETQTKEIWLGPLISPHDLETRLNRAREFLSKQDRVKFTVKFSGREMAHQELGHQLLARVKQSLLETATMDGVPKMMGRNLSAAFSPMSKHKTQELKNEKQDKQSLHS